MLTLDCLMWSLNIRNHLLKDDGFLYTEFKWYNTVFYFHSKIFEHFWFVLEAMGVENQLRKIAHIASFKYSCDLPPKKQKFPQI